MKMAQINVFRRIQLYPMMNEQLFTDKVYLFYILVP